MPEPLVSAKLNVTAIAGRFAAARAVARNPYSGPRLERALRILRYSAPDSIRSQFAQERTALPDGSYSPWKPTVSPWKAPGQRKTLQRTGAYRTAWLGGAGTKAPVVSGLSIKLGVNPGQFKQVGVFQSLKGRRIKANPSNRNERGQLKMQVAIGMGTGVWISEKYLVQKGVYLAPRRLAFSKGMRTALAAYLSEEIRKELRRRA